MKNGWLIIGPFIGPKNKTRILRWVLNEAPTQTVPFFFRVYKLRLSYVDKTNFFCAI